MVTTIVELLNSLPTKRDVFWVPGRFGLCRETPCGEANPVLFGELAGSIIADRFRLANRKRSRTLIFFRKKNKF